MAVRTANVEWTGTLKEGLGVMRLSSGAYEGPYTWASRFEDAQGTNPEELIAAAHAGCFSMKLAGDLTTAGFPPTNIRTTGNAHFEKIEAGWRIVRMHLDTEASVPNIDDTKFQEVAEGAKKACPVTHIFHPDIQITLDAKLV
jgi:osmotically inducible protein OsmC